MRKHIIEKVIEEMDVAITMPGGGLKYGTNGDARRKF